MKIENSWFTSFFLVIFKIFINFLVLLVVSVTIQIDYIYNNIMQKCIFCFAVDCSDQDFKRSKDFLEKRSPKEINLKESTDLKARSA